MKIQYLGTGAAEGVPAMFCNCDFCKAARALGRAAWRTRSQVFIDGVLSVDFPSEAYYHSLENGINFADLKYVLITHSHMDHCYAHDFILRGYKYGVLQNNPLQIYGNAEVLRVFNECTLREMKAEVAKNIILTELKPLCEYKIGDYRLLTLPASHSKMEDALLFYIERQNKGYLHLYDTGLFDGGSFDFLNKKGAKANLVSFDCTFVNARGGAGARHMGIDEDMQIKQKLISCGACDSNTEYVITHFSHNGKPTREALKLIEAQYGVTAAYDGMTKEI